MTEAEIYQARKRLGLFNVTLQSPFTTWLWAQAEKRKHMTEVEQSNSIVGTDLQLAYSLERNSLQERRILELTQELRAAQERIRAAEARGQWRPIETANPRDLEQALILEDGMPVVAEFFAGPGTWEVCIGHELWTAEPTHWMPIPAAPTQREGK